MYKIRKFVNHIKISYYNNESLFIVISKFPYRIYCNKSNVEFNNRNYNITAVVIDHIVIKYRKGYSYDYFKGQLDIGTIPNIIISNDGIYINYDKIHFKSYRVKIITMEGKVLSFEWQN